MTHLVELLRPRDELHDVVDSSCHGDFFFLPSGVLFRFEGELGSSSMCNVFPSCLRCSYLLSLSSMGSGRQRWEESGEAEEVRLLEITRSHNLEALELGLP